MKNARKLLLPLLAAVLAISVLSAGPPKRDGISFRTNKAAVNSRGYVDTTGIGPGSAGIAINGAVQTIDTTAAVNIDEQVEWFKHTTTPSTAYSIGKLFLYTSGTPVNFDTVFVAEDRSVDGVGWIAGAFTNVVFANANDKAVDIPILVDADASNNGFLWQYRRWRIRADGNTAALFPDARLMLRFSSWR